ncbi:MAG: hypothetical protein IPN39_00045 [Chitinophagaceae bacterium]|nr:hypothetical protein [Chitinophagaceae bacterium]
MGRPTKAKNSDSLQEQKDMGGDGWQQTTYGRVSRDVYGFKLGYFSNDYTPIGGATAGAFGNKTYSAPGTLDQTGNELFNGNISFTTLALSKLVGAATTGYSYGYDQLNRLVEMRQHSTGTTSGWSNSSIVTAYRESISYDANGNILKYLRKGHSATPHMDSLTYQYNYSSGKLINNRLNHVSDSIPAGNYSEDIDDQDAGNYQYDYIGNLRADGAEKIDTIRWTVYGKINRIVKSEDNVSIDYSYDAAGNRTGKRVNNNDTISITWYVRDAQGNVMAVYSNKEGTEDIVWKEQHLYGSSRLGMWRADTTVPALPPVVDEDPVYDSVMLGSRTYELTNHLGNVLATISDKKIGNDSSDVVNYYIAEVLSQTDYYPGGMLMPDRKYSAGTGYRYGFNGKEKDTEGPVQYDYGFRIYDPRLVRFKSVDPLTRSYPELTPYQFASNRPIEAIDLDGLEAKDLYMELEPVRQQRRMEQSFGIKHDETPAAKAVGIFVQVSLGATVLAPILVEAPALATSTFSRLFWWAAANPETAAGVLYTIVVAASGYEGPDLPGPADDFGKWGRKVFDKLTAVGVKSEKSLAQAARNSYNAIINTIDNEIKDIATIEQKARKAFDVRNKAKDFARELSGPANRAKAEAQSLEKHGNINGPSFDDLYKKNYDDAMKSGLKEEEAKNKAYQGIIESSKRPDQETNKKYGAN